MQNDFNQNNFLNEQVTCNKTISNSNDFIFKTQKRKKRLANNDPRRFEDL